MSGEKTLNANPGKARWAWMPCPLTCLMIVMIAAVAVLGAIAYSRHDGTLGAGLQSSLVILRRTAPVFLIGVVLAGLLSALVPADPTGKASAIPKSIWISTAIFIVLAAVCMVIAYQRRDGSLSGGLREAWKMFREVWVLLVVAWVFAGYIGELLPQGFVENWLGRESGMRGIFLACILGGLTPGGPFVSLPIVAGLINAKAGEGVIVAYLSAWSLYALGRLPFEISFMDVRLTVVRFISVLPFPPLAGLIAKLLFER